MLRLLADENFDNDIVRGVLRRTTHVDLIRVQDVGLTGANGKAKFIIFHSNHNPVLSPTMSRNAIE